MKMKTYKTSSMKLIALLFFACTGQIVSGCTINADFSFVKKNHYDVVFTDLSTGASAALWDFGNGQTSDDLNPQGFVRYQAPGYYTISLTVWDKNNPSCKDQAYKTIEITDQPCKIMAVFGIQEDPNGNYSSIIHNGSFIQRPGKASIKWYFGDGDSSSQSNPTHTYPGAGAYYLCLKISDSICKSEWCDSIRFDTAGNLKRAIPFSVKMTGGPETGISEHMNGGSLRLYPNPGNGKFAIDEANSLFGGKIYDMTGKLLKELQFDGSTTYTLDLGELQSSIYIVQLQSDDGVYNVRYVRE